MKKCCGVISKTPQTSIAVDPIGTITPISTAEIGVNGFKKDVCIPCIILWILIVYIIIKG